MLSAMGSEIATVAPSCPLRIVKCPPCASSTERQSESSIPNPSAFVVESDVGKPPVKLERKPGPVSLTVSYAKPGLPRAATILRFDTRLCRIDRLDRIANEIEQDLLDSGG